MKENRDKIVLVIDDSPSIRREVKAILENAAYTVRVAGSEFGMLNSIDEYGVLVDIVLMDLTLNEENGLDLVAKLKASKKYADIPVVVITEHADRGNVEMAKILGVQGYIVKPIRADLLRDKIKEVLNSVES